MINSMKPIISDVRDTYYKEVICLRLEYLQSIADKSYLIKCELFCKEHNLLLGMLELQFRNSCSVKDDYYKEFYDWLVHGYHSMH